MSAKTQTFDRKAKFRKTQGAIFYVIFLGAVLVGILGLITLLVQILIQGVPWLSLHLLTDYPLSPSGAGWAQSRYLRDPLDHGAHCRAHDPDWRERSRLP